MAAWLAPAAIALVVALLLDRAVGEAPAPLHPVAWIGRYLGWIGGLIAPRSAQPAPNWTAFWAGALAWYGGAMLSLIFAWLLQWAVLLLHPVLAGMLLGLMLKTLLSWRSVRDDVAQVEAALAQSLDAGRRRLGRLVSREVMQLDAAQVRESAIESLARHLNASLVAPVLWFVIAGLPGAVLYRFADTADAMWGYRGFRGGVHWEWAGKWAARADDVLAWLPARLTALLVASVSGVVAFGRLRAEARRRSSPNSGWPVAAMALALGVRLRMPGGSVLNAEGAAPQPQDIRRALRIAGLAVLVLAAWSVLMLLALHWARR